MSGRGHNPKVPAHLVPFPGAVGGCVSSSQCLWHGGTRPLAMLDRSWLNGRRKMGTKRHHGAGREIHLPAPGTDQGWAEPPWSGLWAPGEGSHCSFPRDWRHQQ